MSDCWDFKPDTTFSNTAASPHGDLDRRYDFDPFDAEGSGGNSPGAQVKFAVFTVLELLLFLLHNALNQEMISEIGFEADLALSVDPLFGWIFAPLPEVTALHLIAAVMALVFVATPILFWSLVLGGLDGDWNQERKAGLTGLAVLYLFVIAGEWVMVNHRIDIGAGSVFQPTTGHEPTLAAFVAMLFMVFNSAIGFGTVYYRAVMDD